MEHIAYLAGFNPTYPQQKQREAELQTRRQDEMHVRQLQQSINVMHSKEKQLIAAIKLHIQRNQAQEASTKARRVSYIRRMQSRAEAQIFQIENQALNRAATQSTVHVARSLQHSVKNMQRTSQTMNPRAVTNMVKSYEKEKMKMEMSEELIEDALSIADDTGSSQSDNREAELLVQQITDELSDIDLPPVSVYSRSDNRHTNALPVGALLSSMPPAPLDRRP